jgi:hypothetical protein
MSKLLPPDENSDYNSCMSAKTLKDVLQRLETWPPEAQAEAVQSLLNIEEKHTGVYRVSDEEWADLQEGIEQANRGEFVPDELIAESDKRHGR